MTSTGGQAWGFVMWCEALIGEICIKPGRREAGEGSLGFHGLDETHKVCIEGLSSSLCTKDAFLNLLR